MSNDPMLFQKVGDKELWLLQREDYCIPAFVQHVTCEAMPDAFLVWPAVELMFDPMTKFYSDLEWRSVGRNGRQLLFRNRDVLEASIKKASGVTPEFYYRWDKQPIKDEEDEDQSIEIDRLETAPSGDDDRFLREVLKQTQIVDIGTLKIIWNAIGQQALRWLLVRRKPINLGFCTIFAIPYRRNWKSILMKTFPRSYSCFTRRETDMEGAMDRMGISRAFICKELMQMDGKKHWCSWKLELIENKVWLQTVENVELQRLNAGKAAYADFIARSIGTLRQLIAIAYRNFICGAGSPSAKFREGGNPGEQILVPTTRRGGISAKEMARSSGDICCDTSLDWKKPRLQSLIDDEIGKVSKLPIAEHQVAQLRITGGYLDQSDKQKS